jgi:hypothetical protein
MKCLRSLEHGFVGSNSTQAMCVCVYSMFVFCCSLATGWSPVQGVLLTVLGLRNWSKTKRFTDALCSKWEQQEKKKKKKGKVVHHSWPRHYVEVSGLLHASAALPPGKEPPAPIGKEAGWEPESIWTLRNREKSLPHPGSWTLAVQPQSVAIPTELSRLTNI